MTRKSYDRWKVERTQYNQLQSFYVDCDCGSLAKRVFNASYFECPMCHKKYGLHNGKFVEIRL